MWTTSLAKSCVEMPHKISLPWNNHQASGQLPCTVIILRRKIMQTELSKVDSEPYHCNFNIRELQFFTNTNIFVLLLHKDLTVLIYIVGLKPSLTIMKD